MSISESDKFRSSYEEEQEEYISNPEMDYESFALQAESENFNSNETMLPEQESMINQTEQFENEQLEESETEYQLFANELRDSDFEGMAFEFVQQLGSNFQGYTQQIGITGESEQIMASPESDNLVNGYFENSVANMVPSLESEMDSFSNYIQTQFPNGGEYETFSLLVDRYQPIQSEDFVKRFARRIAKASKGFVKRGLKKIGGAVKAVAKAGKWLVNKGIILGLRKFINFVKGNIRKILRIFVRRAIRGLPPISRPFFTKAARRIGLAEQMSPEMELQNEMVFENEQFNTFITSELEFETESMVYDAESENESEEEFNALQENENQIAEMMEEFDRQLFAFGENELNNIVNSEASNPYNPESYTPEASNPYNPESYTPEASNPYNPESYTPEASNPYNPEAEMETENNHENMTLAYDNFVTNLRNDLSSFNLQYEQFAPAIITGARIAFKTIPPLRRKVINLIAQGLHKLLGKWIPKNIGDVAYKPLANILLKLMGLESSHPNQYTEQRVFAEALANTTLESLVNTFNLPQSILEGDNYTLEAEVEGIVQQAALNNFPASVVPRMGPISQSRTSLQFVSRGKYQILNRPIRIVLTPSQVNSIRLRNSLTLNRFLRQNYNWDGKSIVTIDVSVFRNLAGMARPFKILQDHFGKGRRIRITIAHLRRLYRLTRRISRLFRLSRFWSSSFPVYFIINKVSISDNLGRLSMESVAPRSSRTRGNDVRAKLDTLGRLNLSFYIDQPTINKIKSLGGTNILTGLRTMMTKMSSSSQTWLLNLLTKLRIPRFISRGIVRLLMRVARHYINRYSSSILRRVNALINNSNGLTIKLRVQLPTNFVQSIRRINPLRIPSLLKSLRRLSISILVLRGYSL